MPHLAVVSGSPLSTRREFADMICLLGEPSMARAEAQQENLGRRCREPHETGAALRLGQGRPRSVRGCYCCGATGEQSATRAADVVTVSGPIDKINELYGGAAPRTPQSQMCGLGRLLGASAPLASDRAARWATRLPIIQVIYR
jgi:hypothetical protein